MFIIFINDVASNSDSSMNMFADDTKEEDSCKSRTFVFMECTNKCHDVRYVDNDNYLHQNKLEK